VYNCHDSRAYSYRWSGILTGLVGIGNWFGLVWFGLVWMGISLSEICQVVMKHWFEIGHES
jgi:hypothetical protein